MAEVAEPLTKAAAVAAAEAATDVEFLLRCHSSMQREAESGRQWLFPVTRPCDSTLVAGGEGGGQYQLF